MNKYSLEGGDGTRVAEKFLPMMEERIIEEIKFSRGKKNLRKFFEESTYDKEKMRPDDFRHLLKDIGMEKKMNSREIG